MTWLSPAAPGASFTLDRYGHLHPESDAALRDRLDAIYTVVQRDQDAAVVEIFQERSRPRRHPRTQGRRRHWAGNGCDLDGAAHR
jgi:hypothetical protein